MWLLQRNQGPELQGRYPKYVDGGTVCLDINSERVKDTTDSICSLGIYGINSGYCLNYEQKENLPLAKWCMGDLMDIGNEERNMLNNSFESNVLKHFNQKQPDWEYLNSLAFHLHQALFLNKNVEGKGRGYESGRIDPTPPIIPTFVQTLQLSFIRGGNTLSEDNCKDPLMCRTNEEDVKEICENLEEVMDKYKTEAIKLLERGREGGIST